MKHKISILFYVKSSKVLKNALLLDKAEDLIYLCDLQGYMDTFEV